jgi:DNA mismatch repair ATPase MutS
LRQPLLKKKEIVERQKMVELFVNENVLRNQLRDGPLKAMPDLDVVIDKLLFFFKKNIH